MPPELQHVWLLLLQVVWPIIGSLPAMLQGMRLGISRSGPGFGCTAHQLAAICDVGDVLTLAGVKLGLVDKPMLAKRLSSGLGLDFLGAVFWTGFLLPRLGILLTGLLFPPREFLVEVACSAFPT